MSARRTAPLLALTLTAVLLAGCGSSKPGPQIPAQQASNIIGRLQEAQRRSDARACHDLQTNTIPALEQQVAALPPNLDQNVRTTVTNGISRLKDLVGQQCAAKPQQQQQTTQTTQTAPPTTTQTTPAPTTQTHTTPPPPHPTPPPTTTQTTPTGPAGGVSPGNGNGPSGNGPPGQGKKKGKGGD